jgi:hypothetical protein
MAASDFLGYTLIHFLDGLGLALIFEDADELIEAGPRKVVYWTEQNAFPSLFHGELRPGCPRAGIADTLREKNVSLRR